jgi:hypothetical protein
MIEVELRGDREVVARFQALSPKVHLRVVKAMNTALARLEAFVKGGKLSGQVLHVRTGALRRSITFKVDETTDVITGQVGVFSGPTVSYGKAHEYGFDGVVSVKAHLRTIKQAFGRPIEPTVVPVREHSMTLHLAERSFLRSTLAEFRAAVLQLFAEAVHEAVHAS